MYAWYWISTSMYWLCIRIYIIWNYLCGQLPSLPLKSSNGDIVFVLLDGLVAPFLIVCSKVELAFGNELKMLTMKGGLLIFSGGSRIFIIHPVFVAISIHTLGRSLAFDFVFFFMFVIEVQGAIGGGSSGLLWDRGGFYCLFRRALPGVIDIGIFCALLHSLG